MKRAVAVLLGMLACSAGARSPFDVVDLNSAVLDRLAADEPARYVKIAAILEAAGEPPCDNEATKLLKASEELKQMRCASLLLTSYPAKRQLYFVLEGSAYSARVTMRYGEPELRKAVGH